MPRRDVVRILLVGDGELIFSWKPGCIFPGLMAKSAKFLLSFLNLSDGVGKSTIITSLIKESFVSNVRSLALMINGYFADAILCHTHRSSMSFLKSPSHRKSHQRMLRLASSTHRVCPVLDALHLGAASSDKSLSSY